MSLGQQCELVFSQKGGEDIKTLTVSDRSLYHMSRKSQDFFEHRIDQGSVGDGVRYSLTFRALDWKNKNSTCIIGDSNTAHLKFGSDKRKTFGELMPGRRYWAAKVEDIEPENACSYDNVVVMCGTNNVRQYSVSCERNIADIYKTYKSKINE